MKRQSIQSTGPEAQRLVGIIVDELEPFFDDEFERLRIRLALDEAIINAVKHGNQFDPSKTVEVYYDLEPGQFYCKIIDEGNGFDPDELPDPRADENLERENGRGWLLMNHCMDEVEVDGGTVTMSKTTAAVLR